jgi:hypothetical protein
MKSLIKDLAMLQKEAALCYNEATQQSYQSICEFVLYLQQWADQLPYQYTDKQRKDHLWLKVLKVI